MQFWQLHRYGGWLGTMTWPQPIQRNHSPSDCGVISLKLFASVQYGHRIASGIRFGGMPRAKLIPQGGAIYGRE
jgi:hypothetical protein